MRDKQDWVNLTVRFDRQLYLQLKQKAHNQKMPMSALIRSYCTNGLERRD